MTTDNRTLALSWWRSQREMEKMNLTKKYFPFKNHRYVNDKEVETIYNKVMNRPFENVNLNKVDLKEFINPTVNP